MNRMALAVVVGLAAATPAAAQVVYGGVIVRPVPVYPGFGFPGPFPPPPFGPPLPPPWAYPPGFVGTPNLNRAGTPLGPPVVVPDAPDLPRSNPAEGPPGAKPGQFLVISPKRDPQPAANPNVPEGTVSPAVDRVKKPEPLARFDPAAAPAGNTEKPEADPDREFARLMKLAREAFAAEEYGRAVGFLDRAAKAKPADPQPHFVRAQALVAAGQYADAVTAIGAGMKLAPDWPAGGFRLKELYGATADRFPAHVAAVRAALTEHPGDPGLQFLLGYELWFGDGRAEAAELFAAAARGSRNNPVVVRFLKEANKK